MTLPRVFRRAFREVRATRMAAWDFLPWEAMALAFLALAYWAWSWMPASLPYRRWEALERSRAASMRSLAARRRILESLPVKSLLRARTSSEAARLFSSSRARSLPRARMDAEWRSLDSLVMRLSSAEVRRFTRSW